MHTTDMTIRRLRSQHLTGNPLDTAQAVVHALCCVQAQDYLGTQWALAMRMGSATPADIDRALADGSILRTHVMRPTWHFVTPRDIRWVVELTAPHVQAGNAYMYRKMDLPADLRARCNDLIVKALEGGNFLTRPELGDILAAEGIEADGLRLSLIMMNAELETLICSGPRKGNPADAGHDRSGSLPRKRLTGQFTYALLDERAPDAIRLTRDEALAELTLRYFTGHGPATVRDIAWWSGLTMAEAKRGLGIVDGALAREEIDGVAHWVAPSDQDIAAQPFDAYLMPTYDEFVIGYNSFDQVRRGGVEAAGPLVFDSTIVIGGKIVGSWRRTFQKKSVVIELAPFIPFSKADRAAVETAAHRYGAFLNLPVEFAPSA